MSYCGEGVGRGEGGKEGGREKIRKCIVDLLSSGAFLPFPSLSPRPQRGLAGWLHAWLGLPVEIRGSPVVTGRWVPAQPARRLPDPVRPPPLGRTRWARTRIGDRVRSRTSQGAFIVGARPHTTGELWQPGKVPSLWHQNSRALLQTQPLAGFRGSRVGPAAERTPLPTGNEVWLQTHSPWGGPISRMRSPSAPLLCLSLQAFHARHS